MSDTPRTDSYYAELEAWDKYVKQYGHIPEAMEQCPVVQSPQEFAQTLEQELGVLEAFRPLWAQGYSSDSIAAQTTAAALAAIWKLLDVKDQTAAMARLRRLVE